MTGPKLRLALRVEGNFWVAYCAEPGTMVGAKLLGSIAMRFVQNPKRKKAFMKLMRESMSDILEEVTGKRPVWEEPGGHEAPPHERAGNA